MKTRVLKTAVLFAEIVGEFLAVAAAVAGYLFWRVEQGPLEVGAIEAAAESAINRQLPQGHVADVTRVFIEKDRDTGAYQLVLDDMFVWDQSGRAVLRLDSARLIFPSRNLAAARFSPTEILLDSPTIDLVRSIDRRFRVDYGAIDRPQQTETNLSKILNSSPYFNRTFENARIENATVMFLDEASGRLWRSDGARARVERSANGFSATLDADFDNAVGGAAITLDASLDRRTGVFDASVAIENAPIGDLLEVFLGATAPAFDAPVTGSAALKLSQNGKVLSSRLSGAAEPGRLQIGAVETDIQRFEVDAAFDPERNLFDIARLVVNTDRGGADIKGQLTADFEKNGRTPASIAFDLSASDVVIAQNGLFEAALAPEYLKLKGSVDLRSGAFAAENLETVLAGAAISGDFYFQRPPATETGEKPSPIARANLNLDGVVGKAAVLRAWPKTVGLGARDFVRDRISNATVSNLRAVLDLPAGAIDEAGGLPNEALTVTFNVNGADVIYAPGMTPVTGASGVAVLKGNSFRIDIPKAKIDDIALSNGEVVFSAFRPKGAPSYFRFDAAGDIGDVLTVLNQEPFALLKSTQLQPGDFAGGISAAIEIMRPNRRDMPLQKYEFSGKARFQDLSINEFYGGIGLTGVEGTLDLRSKDMTVVASANLGGAPVDVRWDQSFYSDGDRSKFNVSGAVDSSTGDILGIPTRQFLRGAVRFNAAASGDIGAFRTLS
ncbi:MAG: DUF3971 domain-containing protein, partial [Pseudomonadota bacterium]